MVKNEPVLTGITALVTSTIGLLVAFGLDFTDEQTGAVVAFVAAAYGIGALVRQLVTPTTEDHL